MEYSRCELGQRCVVKTTDSYLFRKFTLLVAISNSKCVGYMLYKKVLKFDELQKEVSKATQKVKKENYKNYFLYAYKKSKLTLPDKKKSTLRRKPKNYKK